MNLKYNPECYKCLNSGFYINTLGVYINCPVCHDNRQIRILKESIFKLLVKLFKLSSDALNKINWASEDTIRFARFYNVELEGKVQQRQKLPFESYKEVFESGNPVLQNKVAYKIVSNYVTGYTESEQLVGTALEVLTGSKALLPMAVEVHNSSSLGKDATGPFWNALNESLKN